MAFLYARHIDIAPIDDDHIIDIVMQINPAGKLIVRGSASLPGISDGASNTVLIAETRGASAACAADDGGQEGITGLAVPFRVDRSSERISAFIRLDDPLVQDGDYRATLVFDRELGEYAVNLSVNVGDSPRR